MVWTKYINNKNRTQTKNDTKVRPVFVQKGRLSLFLSKFYFGLRLKES